MIENEYIIERRKAKIQTVHSVYNLSANGYMSFSGGKDSTALHYLIDEALPKNTIPRVFIDTGIEYKSIVEFVRKFAERDKRFVIIKPSRNIVAMLQKYGYPFKSKDHAKILHTYQRSGILPSVKSYLDPTRISKYGCPQKLLPQFTPDYKLKVSPHCCEGLKKQPIGRWSRENNRPIAITGIRASEGGARSRHSNCLSFGGKDNKSPKKFHPLLPVTDETLEWFIETRGFELCELYYPPFNFERTGCKGCPFNIRLQDQLDVMQSLLPYERKQCEIIWEPVYAEYRRLNYRLKPDFQNELDFTLRR